MGSTATLLLIPHLAQHNPLLILPIVISLASHDQPGQGIDCKQIHPSFFYRDQQTLTSSPEEHPGLRIELFTQES